ncbi:MAG: hypothetical protein NZ828_09605 [Alphaproteobacteria bacterium]|nr:hypothetical protein [Alphaproteobacteria bacterium]
MSTTEKIYKIDGLDNVFVVTNQSLPTPSRANGISRSFSINAALRAEEKWPMLLTKDDLSATQLKQSEQAETLNAYGASGIQINFEVNSGIIEVQDKNKIKSVPFYLGTIGQKNFTKLNNAPAVKFS